MLRCIKWILLVAMVALQSAGQGQNYDYLSQQQTHLPVQVQGERMGKDLLDWIGLGTGPEQDPFVARTNAACLNGDLAECFKSRALTSLDEFFTKAQYDLNENIRVIRMPSEQLRALNQEPYEFSSAPRSDEPEWDQLVKFVMRKVEKFLKSTAIEVHIPDEVTEQGRYSPRFIDEIADEIDTIENKKDTLFSRKRLRKLVIPFLIVLKLFKLKLLLFLPLILGLASFKKFLGFLAIIIPGALAYFKFCKPDFGHNSFYQAPQYTQAGLGLHGHGGFHHQAPHFLKEQGPLQDITYGGGHGHYDYNQRPSGVAFREDSHSLAYSGYGEYRSAKGDTEAEVSTKKSILPDS